MTFAVGETVVYPHHGAALIEAIETRTIRARTGSTWSSRSPRAT
jgi:RNA polymerase-interacting CarD/CdnL/TRCF family regulator